MLALSIRQPWAELILRGIKTVEYRRRPTRIIGQRFYIYASRGSVVRAAGSERSNAAKVWSRDLEAVRHVLPDWMIELAEQLILGGEPLPRGVIVGTAVISKCAQVADHKSSITSPAHAQSAAPIYEWHLTDVERIETPRKPARHPQPAWFNPF